MIFQDEVSQEIVVDAKSGGEMAEHAFSDLEGRLKPGTKEYQALLHVIEQEMKADKNIEVPSLTELRKKYDQAFQRLALLPETEKGQEVSRETADTSIRVPPTLVPPSAEQTAEQTFKQAEARTPTSLELHFSVIPEAGYTNPALKGFRLIPLQTGAMLVAESGDKRVYSFRDLKGGADGDGMAVEVSVGDFVESGSLLALRRRESVWLIHLSGTSKQDSLKIDWSKKLEFPFSEAEPQGEKSLKITFEDQAIAVESGTFIRRLAQASGRLLAEDAQGEEVLSPGPAKAREPASPLPAGDLSIVQPIED